MGQSPSLREPGTVIAIWYTPAEPDASAAPKTVAGMLPMLMDGRVAVDYV
jgi:hypothetical protein